MSGFSFKVRLTPKRSIISVIIASLLAFMTTKCGIPREEFLKYYNEIRKMIKWDLPDSIIDEFDNELNRRINEDPDLLQYKVESEVNDAIRRYKQSLPPETSRMTDKDILRGLESSQFTDTQKEILKDAIYYECPKGVMGIRGVWVDKDPECH